MDAKTMVPIAVIVSVVATAGAMYAIYSVDAGGATNQLRAEPQIAHVPKSFSGNFEGTHEIKKISSQGELEEIISASVMLDGYPYYGGDTEWTSGGPDEFSSIALDDALYLQSTRLEQSGAPTSSPDYSSTNVQIGDVDEPDYVKNDAKYVYIVLDKTLSIIDAYPAESAELVLKVALDIESKSIENMFLNGDRLVIFYDGQTDRDEIPEFGYEPRTYSVPATHALIVDVSDKKNPEILKDYAIDGYFRDARMIGDHAYFVTNTDVRYQDPAFPVILEDAVPVMTPEAYYFDTPDRLTAFNTITAIDIADGSIRSETYLMGYTGTFYVSEDHLYLAYLQDIVFDVLEDSPQDRFFGAVVPLLPKDLQEKIGEIRSRDGEAGWAEIANLLQDQYNRMDDEDRKDLFERIRDATEKYDSGIKEDAVRTIIHKISLDGQNTEYVARGIVPGMLLNQFSMDQDGDRFRIATTTETYTSRGSLEIANAVYVLDENMKAVGELENIAPDESIFSARFMGDRLYLVTFQQVDPFFVIDLSSDTPKILGELKIPGFSNYLHPYDEDHVIGIGRDTTNKDGWVRQLGIKIALFNVADVANPKVAADIVIGEDSTYSDALDDHKAFFFERGVLSIPVTGFVSSLDGVSGSAADDLWNGFYVFDLDEDGFDLKGKIAHSYLNQYEYIEIGGRTFYIGGVLYTLSEDRLKMNDFEDLGEINSVKLKGTGKFVEFVK
ncbi:MAG: copper amine oxidase [Nitrosopumilus sp. H8]|nr:MAG: copper amine oxidase [Nitrosopumilus sp. H8]